MGKKRMQKDRAYQTASEWREEGGGHRGRLQGARGDFRRLPFNCCAISFQPVEDAVCTVDGTVMDIVNAVPYVQKHKRHPATGAPLELRDLVRLQFHRNTDNEFACPVLGKVFNENTHIVAIRPTGNVYCWEAIDELCLKPKNMRDLLTDEAFTKKDIIHIQDPQNLQGKNLAEFDHVKHGRTVGDEAERAAEEADPMFGIKAVDDDTRRTLAALGSDEAAAAFAAGGGGKKAQAERALADAKAKAAGSGNGSGGGGDTAAAEAGKQPSAKQSSDPRLRSAPRDPNVVVAFKPGTATWNTDAPPKPGAPGASKDHQFDANEGRKVPPPFSQQFMTSHITTGAASKSFTSTATTVATRNERIMVRQQLKPTKKGYLQLHTSLGDLNFELHADLAPQTCENFLALAEGGYYTGTHFHRSIKNFMIQGGDPTGTGKGGTSVFGETFPDELDSRLLHDSRGILSMANSGPGTNGSQFFILYKSAHHLDYKHTVFGRVVGGFDTLTKMEKVPTDDEDMPLQELTITGVTVFVNPYKDLIEEERKKKEAEEKKVQVAEGRHDGDGGEYRAWFSDPAGTKAAAAKNTDGIGGGGGGGGVGKYLKLHSAASGAPEAGAGAPSSGGGTGAQPAAKKAKVGGASLANFDAW